MASKTEKRLRDKISALRDQIRELEAENEEIKIATRKFLGLAEWRYEMLWGWAKAWKELARTYRRRLKEKQ